MTETIYERGASDTPRITAEWDSGLSWIAHPAETGQRGSHAIRTDGGVWLVDPLAAPGIDERLDSLGDVCGVAVCSSYHARDAGEFARRHDVSVHIPDWMPRIEARVEAPIERYTDTFDDAVRCLPCRPLPGWNELFSYHESSGTLLVPDSLGTADPFLVGDQRLGLELFRRLQPPHRLADLEPDRILVGHGPPITDSAPETLRTVLDGARWSFPKALLRNGPESIRAITAAIKD